MSHAIHSISPLHRSALLAAGNRVGKFSKPQIQQLSPKAEFNKLLHAYYESVRTALLQPTDSESAQKLINLKYRQLETFAGERRLYHLVPTRYEVLLPMLRLY